MQKSSPILAIILASCCQAHSATLDWSTGSWDNGAGYNAGYDGGATSGSTISKGIIVSTAYEGFHLTPVNGNLNATTRINGGGTDPALVLAVGEDSNVGSTLTDYSRMTFSFSQAVALSDPFTIFDVDQSDPIGGYNDYIVVRARIGGSAGALVGITYTTTGTNQKLDTDYGFAGVQANAGQVDQTSPSGNVTITPTDSFDFLEIYFTQAEGNTGGQDHAIGISDMAFTAVPEPSTYALLAAGLGLLAWRTARTRKATA